MATLTLQPVMDVRIEGILNPDANYGSGTVISHSVGYFGGDKTFQYRGIGEFDVSELADVILISAQLVREIYTLTNGGQQAKVSRITRPGEIVEDEVTWNDYRSGGAWTSGGGDFDDAGPPAAITFTEPSSAGTHELAGLLPFVEDALEKRDGIVSLLLRLDDEAPGVTTVYSWRSQDYDVDAWRLVVEFERPDAGRRSVPPAARGRKRPGVRAAQPHRSVASARPARPARPEIRRRP